MDMARFAASTSVAALLVTAALSVSPACAQVTDVGASESDEILVTARRRAEAVQDVPVTVNVVAGAEISARGAVSLTDLPVLAPGLNLTKAPNANEVGITIRGLGSNAGVPSFESSVSLFVDGVYAPRSREFTASLFDIERIEVVRGTQAALLGKNTSLGAVNLITRKPGDRYALDARAAYEFNLDSTIVSAGADLPLSETFRLRMAGQTQDQGGWVRNMLNGRDAQRMEDDAIRAVAVWEPAEGLDVTALYQHDVARSRGTAAEFVQTNGVPEQLQALAGVPGTLEARLDRRNALSSQSVGELSERLRIDRLGFTVNYAIGEHTLTSVTSYSDYSDRGDADVDFQAGDYLVQTLDEEGRQFTQELRLVSPSDRGFDYVVGALYLDGRLDNVTTLDANYPFGPAPGVNITGAEATGFAQDNEAISLFGQGGFQLADGLKATAGLRWTRETKEVDLVRDVLRPGPFSIVVYPDYTPFTLERTESNVDYSAGLQYAPRDGVLAYASYGRGTKSGGFAQSVTRLDQSEYEEEVAKTAEIGLKLGGGRSMFNIAAFNTLVDDFQLVTFNGIAFTVGNTNLRSRGVEVEAHATPVDGLRLFVNATYADAEDRRTGAAVPLAPKLTGSTGFGYETDLSSALRLLIDGSIDHRSKRYYQQDPAASPPGDAFTTLNLSAALAGADDRWELRLIGRNLTDASSYAFAFPAPILPAGNQLAIAERPRTVTLQLSTRF